MAKLLRCIFGKAGRSFDVTSDTDWSFSHTDFRAAYYDLLAHYRELEADYDALSRVNYKLNRENCELRGEISEMREELDSTQYPMAYHDLERDYGDLQEDYEELEEELERVAERLYREEAKLSLRYRQNVEECERLRRDFESLHEELEESAMENAALQKEVDQWRTGFEQLYAHVRRCESRIADLEGLEVQHLHDASAGTTSLNRELTDVALQDDAVRPRQLEAPSTVDDSNRYSHGTSTTIEDFD